MKAFREQQRRIDSMHTLPTQRVCQADQIRRDSFPSGAVTWNRVDRPAIGRNTESYGTLHDAAELARIESALSAVGRQAAPAELPKPMIACAAKPSSADY